MEDEIFLDDLERIVAKNMSEFHAQFQLAKSIIHVDLLVNTLMVDLGDTHQINF